MRNIRFRAWYRGRMYYEVEHSTYRDSGKVTALAGIRADLYAFSPEGDVELMQYTGLADKHGKDIYEGDIVQSDRGLFEVFWRDGFAGFYLRKVALKAGEPDWIDLISMTGNVTWCEIVGNIWEQPELTHGKA